MKYSIFTIILFAFIALNLLSCSKETTTDPVITENNDSTYAPVSDSVLIGNQWWLSENLRTITSASGENLNGVYAYDNDENNVAEYGRLYTWESAMIACPNGWHLPSNAEWEELLANLGSNPGDKLREGGASGFEAKMGGRLSGDSYGYIGELGAFWTSTESGDHATQKLIVNNEPNVITDDTEKSGGLSVRCVKD